MPAGRDECNDCAAAFRRADLRPTRPGGVRGPPCRIPVRRL